MTDSTGNCKTQFKMEFLLAQDTESFSACFSHRILNSELMLCMLNWL